MKKKELLTIANFAKQENVTTAAIYKRIKLGKLKVKEISGIKFIEV